jgi:hypothetical protein
VEFTNFETMHIRLHTNEGKSSSSEKELIAVVAGMIRIKAPVPALQLVDNKGLEANAAMVPECWRSSNNMTSTKSIYGRFSL